MAHTIIVNQMLMIGLSGIIPNKKSLTI